MTIQPKVSILVAIYNVERYLKTCLDSLINQTYDNLEIILVNDGSTDSSGIIADEYAKKDPRIKVVHQENRGLSGARNAGLEVASGQYVAFVDSDDYVSGDYVECLLNSIMQNKSQIACAPHFRVKNKDIIRPKNIKTGCCSGRQMAEGFLMDQTHDYDAAWGKLFCLDLIHDLRFPLGKRHEDLAFLFESYCRVEIISFVKKPIYYYLERQGSITRLAQAYDYDYDLVENAWQVAKSARRKQDINQGLILGYLTRKHLSYLYTRVRKKSPAHHEKKVQSWLRDNSRQIVANKNIDFSMKVLTITVLFGGFFYKIIFKIIFKIRSM